MTQYILTVTAAAILVSVLQKLAGSGTMGALIRMLAGVFMALTVMAPMVKLELPDPARWLAGLSAEGEAAAAEGERMGNDAAFAIIKDRTEAYILDKAAGCGAALAVQVTLDETGVPAAVTLTGSVSPYARTRLERIIASDLGIGEEDQQWIS